jgi:hypothetical protein
MYLVVVILLFAITESQTQSLPTGFQQLLKRTAMLFAVPPDFTAIPIVANGDVAYDYGVKSKTMKLEIRYRVWPIESRSTSDRRGNRQLEPMLMAMALNISAGEEPKVAYFPTDAVRTEFGADVGATCAVKVKSDFGRGYKICLISAIHKEDVADAYVFYLCDDLSVARRALATESIFHALRFK